MSVSPLVGSGPPGPGAERARGGAFRPWWGAHPEPARAAAARERGEPGAAGCTHLFEAEGHGEDTDPHYAVHYVHDQPPVGGGGRGHGAGSGAREPGGEGAGTTAGWRGPDGDGRAAAWRRRPCRNAAGEVNLHTPPGPTAASWHRPPFSPAGRPRVPAARTLKAR